MDIQVGEYGLTVRIRSFIFDLFFGTLFRFFGLNPQLTINEIKQGLKDSIVSGVLHLYGLEDSEEAKRIDDELVQIRLLIIKTKLQSNKILYRVNSGLVAVVEYDILSLWMKDFGESFELDLWLNDKKIKDALISSVISLLPHFRSDINMDELKGNLAEICLIF